MPPRIDLESLTVIDRETKPANADAEWSSLQVYYEDCSRSVTASRLDQLGVGVDDNARPIEIQLLRRIIDRIAVVYDSPPTRFLEQANGKRYKETSEQHKQMLRIVKKSQLDLAWAETDKMRGLHRQSVLRFFPSKHERSVVCRLFPPHTVKRRVDPACSHLLDHDDQIAFKLTGKIWEIWTRTDGGWSVVRTDDQGDPIGRQPGEYRDGMSPYGDELPAVIVYDKWPGGRAWFAPRHSRRSWVEACNAIANDLWNLIINQAHSQRIWKSDDPDAIPEERGPDTEIQVPEDADVEDLTPNPKIKECNDVLDRFVALWNWSEDLPKGDLDKRTEIETGASLRVHERPLAARREAQKPLAEADEPRAWRKLVAVHNAHADGWGVPEVAHQAEMAIELAPMDQPVSDEELLNAYAKKLGLGSASVIDLIQQQYRVTRSSAIAMYERIKEDMALYPPNIQDVSKLESGTKAADPVDPPKDGASMLQAVAKAG